MASTRQRNVRSSSGAYGNTAVSYLTSSAGSKMECHYRSRKSCRLLMVRLYGGSTLCKINMSSRALVLLRASRGVSVEERTSNVRRLYILQRTLTVLSRPRAYNLCYCSDACTRFPWATGVEQVAKSVTGSLTWYERRIRCSILLPNRMPLDSI